MLVRGGAAVDLACRDAELAAALLHVPVEEGQHLFGILAEIVVPIEATRCAFDPEQVLVVGAEKVERLLAVFRRGPQIVAHLHDEGGHIDIACEQMRRHLGIGETAKLFLLEIHCIEIIADAIQLGELAHQCRHRYNQWAEHAQNVFEHLGSPRHRLILGIAAGALAVKAELHPGQLRMGIDIGLRANAVSPFITPDAADPAIGSAAIAVIAQIIGQHIVTCAREMGDVGNEVDLDVIDLAPGFAEMAGKAGPAHRHRMVHHDQAVALPTHGGYMPAFQGRAVIGLEIDVLPIWDPVIGRRLVNGGAEGRLYSEARKRLDHGKLVSGNCRLVAHLSLQFGGDHRLLAQAVWRMPDHISVLSNPINRGASYRQYIASRCTIAS